MSFDGPQTRRRFFTLKEQQVRDWIEQVLQISLNVETPAQLEKALRSRGGRLLCELADELIPGGLHGEGELRIDVLDRIPDDENLPLAQQEELAAAFLQGCRHLGVDEQMLFEPHDLMFGRNIVKVIYCLHELIQVCRKEKNPALHNKSQAKKSSAATPRRGRGTSTTPARTARPKRGTPSRATRTTPARKTPALTAPKSSSRRLSTRRTPASTSSRRSSRLAGKHAPDAIEPQLTSEDSAMAIGFDEDTFSGTGFDDDTFGGTGFDDDTVGGTGFADDFMVPPDDTGAGVSPPAKKTSETRKRSTPKRSSPKRATPNKRPAAPKTSSARKRARLGTDHIFGVGASDAMVAASERRKEQRSSLLISEDSASGSENVSEESGGSGTDEEGDGETQRQAFSFAPPPFIQEQLGEVVADMPGMVPWFVAFTVWAGAIGANAGVL